MRTQLEGLSKVLAQTTALQDLFAADDAAEVLSVNTFYGSTQDQASLPTNYAVYTLASDSNFISETMAGDSYTRNPKIELTLFISELDGADTPEDWYLEAVDLFETLVEEIYTSFVSGDPVYESDGTGKISLLAVEWDQDDMELGPRASDGEYMTLTLLFTLRGE
jgi:hypothetical protein